MLWIIGRISFELKQYLLDHQIEFGIFTDVRYPTPKLKLATHGVDFASPESIKSSLKSFDGPEVTAVVTAGIESYVEPLAIIAEHFSVAGPTVAAAHRARDKAAMRRAFTEHDPTISPAFAVVTSESDIAAFASQHNFPLMLKPTNLMKSMFITKNKDLEEILANYRLIKPALEALERGNNHSEATGIIVEECLIGSLHTVVGFVDSQGDISLHPVIVDCLPAPNRQRADNYIYARQLPSKLNASSQTAILEVAQRAVQALEITSTALHIELILTASGPKIVEIGARLGGYRPLLYAQSCDSDLYQASIAIAEGKSITLSANVTTQNYCSAIELFPDHDGILAVIENEAIIPGLPSLYDYKRKIQFGDQIGLASHGFRGTAYLILKNSDKEAYEADFQEVANRVKVIVK
jgi:hypothetical protein